MTPEIFFEGKTLPWVGLQCVLVVLSGHNHLLLLFKQLYHEVQLSCGPRCEKTCLQRFAKNKGADQHARMRSLISAFAIRLLESTTSRPVKSEI